MTQPCPHRPECPGCDLLEIPYEDQLRRKTDAAREALARYPALRGVRVEPCIGTDQRAGWRTRSKWAVDGAAIGLYGPGHAVIDTPSCLVAAPAALAVAERLRRRPPEGRERLVALDVRVARDGACVPVLVVEAADPQRAWAHAERLADLVHGCADVRGVAVSWRKPGAPTTLGNLPERLRGETTLEDRVGAQPLLYPAGSFSQAHAAQTEVLQRLVAEAVASLPQRTPPDVIDLYAGTGGLGLAVAHKARRVTLVEANGPAMDAARESARRLGLSERTSVVARTAERALPELRAQRPVVAIVDPPRTGLSATVLAGLVRLAPDLLVAVSCDARTLARDLAILHPFGYAPGPVQPVDLQPGTSQVECVVAVRPGPPPLPRAVASGPGWAMFDKPPLLPTTPHPEWPTSLVALARATMPGASAAHRLDAGTSGLVLVREPGVEGPDLQRARKTYLALVRGIARQSGTLRADLPEDGRLVAAETRYRRLEVVGGHSLLEVELVTGRTHQIRRHLAGVGHPVLGDARYGDAASNRHVDARHGLVRPFLHAHRIEGPDGTFVSPLWPDLEQALQSLRQAPSPRPKPRRKR